MNVTLGYRLSSLFGVAAEMNVPTSFRVIGYDPLYQVHYSHREPTYSAFIHFRLPTFGIVGPELMAGASFVQEMTVYQDASPPRFASPPQFTIPKPYGPYGPEVSTERDTVAASGGIDVRFRVNNHLDVVPQVRVYAVRRVPDSPKIYTFPEPAGIVGSSLSVAPGVIRVALGLRAAF